MLTVQTSPFHGPAWRPSIVSERSLASFFNAYCEAQKAGEAFVSLIHQQPSERASSLFLWLSTFSFEEALEVLMAYRHRHPELLASAFAYYLSRGYDMKTWVEGDDKRLYALKNVDWSTAHLFLGVPLAFDRDPEALLATCREPTFTPEPRIGHDYLQVTRERENQILANGFIDFITPGRLQQERAIQSLRTLRAKATTI